MSTRIKTPAPETESVSDVRKALVLEAWEYFQRRQPYSVALRGKTEWPSAEDAGFDAYEALCAAGGYGQILSAFMRDLMTSGHQDLADRLASIVYSVMHDGDDFLSDANEDLFDVLPPATPRVVPL